MTSTSIVPSLIIAHATAISILTIIFNGASKFHNVTDALGFYGVYHRNPINQVIHFFGVPCIIWSLFIFLAHLTLPIPILNHIHVNIPFAPTHLLNYATILTIGYILFYIKIDPFGGTLYVPFAYFMYVTAVSMTIKDQQCAKNNETYKLVVKEKEKSKIRKSSWIGTGKALRFAFIVHVAGWYVQVHPGHGIFEGAKPAVMQSIGGALTSAPLFAYYEGLWVLGLNKELQEKTKALVDVYTKQMCDNGEVMRACADYN